MNNKEKLKIIADKCNSQLKKFPHIKNYLNNRLITDELIDLYNLGYGSFYGNKWITIPIYNIENDCFLIKLRKDPENNNEKNKFKFYPAGSKVTIYGLDNFLDDDKIVICEGEMDRILLEANGIKAIASTGGVATFKDDWIELLKNKTEIWICFDNDKPGHDGAERLGQRILDMYNEAIVFDITLPESLGKGGDITDYFLKTDGNIDTLLYDLSELVKRKIQKECRPAPVNSTYEGGEISDDDITRAKSVNCKDFVKIVRHSYGTSWAHCPFGCSDSNPSMCCYEGSKGFYTYCCGIGGDAISLVQKLYNLNFVEAVKYILKK